MPGGYMWNHVDTLKKIESYYYSHFLTGDTDPQGFRKYFFNICKPACDIATKFIDLDTKDIQLLPIGRGNEMPVWAMDRRLFHYLRDNEFGSLMNEGGDQYPKGHVVFKIADGKPSLVNILNIRTDTTAKFLKNSDFVYELLPMTKGEIQDMDWDTDKKTELFERHPDAETFHVYDCYERKGKKWKHYVLADIWSVINDGTIKMGSEAAINSETNACLDGISMLDKNSTVDKLPYEEVKWEHVPGRWLGYGFVEYLFDDQISENEAENLERDGLRFTALKLFQTRDETLAGQNVLTNARNGDILYIESELNPVATEERNLPSFVSVRQRRAAQIQSKTFTTDIARGENLPSRTPLGVAEISAGMVSAFYDVKRENWGMFWKRIIMNYVIPSFVEDTASEEHYLMFASSDEEITDLNRFVIDTMVDDAKVKRANETGFFPSEEEVFDIRQRIETQVRNDKNRYAKIPKYFYQNAKYLVDVVTTSENINMSAQAQMAQLALQTLNNNPGILQNQQTRTIFFKLLSFSGMNPIDMGLSVEPAPEEQGIVSPLQPGGSLGAPAPAQAAQTVQTNSF